MTDSEPSTKSPTPQTHDLLVVGGGINGVGIARDAAGRGLSVLLVEQDDLAAHTSSASTKLIHGGLRYLEYYEFKLVRKALAERERLIGAAPHIMWPMRFVMPHDAHLRPTWMIRAGLFFYDNLATRRRLQGSRGVDLRKHPAGVALQAGFRRGFEYSDGWVDDARLVVLNAMDARTHGATILTRTRCESVRREAGAWRAVLAGPQGRREVAARALVNAAGPWAAEFLKQRTPLASQHKVRLVKGSHIVVRRLFEHDYAYIFQAPDRRIIFALPYEQDYTLIGTTDVEHVGDPGAAQISTDEVDYLCAMAGRYFKDTVTPADVVWNYSGLRPLLEDDADDPSSVTRDYTFDLDEQGAPALSVFGGKLTTFRVLAEEAVDLLAPKLGNARTAWTAGATLPGGDLPGGDFERFLAVAAARWPWLPQALRQRMARAYGSRMERIVGSAQGVADLGEEVLPGLYAAEIDYLIREEWARTAADILWRRSKLGLHLGPHAPAILAGWLAQRRGPAFDARDRAGFASASSPNGSSGGKTMSRYVLALDQGTTSSRSILFDRAGNIVASAHREFTQYFPQPGWVEHDANEIWVSQAVTIAEVLARAEVVPGELSAVGITNQRETVVLWDRATGQPLAPAIVWQDRRTSERCDALRAAGHEALVMARTGLRLDPYFSGTKLAWLLDHLPGARERAERGELCFGTVDSWLAWKLTGGRAHVTDISNASRTLLLNLHTGEWDPEMLALFGVPAACLPRVLPSSFDAGLMARIEGHEVPLTGIAGDQQAALFGQNCFQPGMAKNTYGTGCFMLMNTGTQPLPSRNRLLTTVAWDCGGRHYALEGSVFVGGAVVQWLRDGLGLIERSADVEALAASVSDSGGVFLVPAFTGLGSPHWDPYARGSLLGLSRGSHRGHIARAALESIAFQSAELLGAMQADASQPLVELRVDGGATANDLLMQFQADLLGVPVVRPRVTETTALGAAYLAGLATGFWSSQAELAASWQMERQFEPAISRDQAGELMRRWSRAVERSRGWIEV